MRFRNVLLWFHIAHFMIKYYFIVIAIYKIRFFGQIIHSPPPPLFLSLVMLTILNYLQYFLNLKLINGLKRICIKVTASNELVVRIQKVLGKLHNRNETAFLSRWEFQFLFQISKTNITSLMRYHFIWKKVGHVILFN